MPQLVEFDVGEQAAGHGKDQCGIEEDEAGLADMRIVEKDQASGNDTSRQTVSRLPHNQVCDRHGQGAEDGRERSECDIGDLVGNVRVANVVEVEVAIITN